MRKVTGEGLIAARTAVGTAGIPAADLPNKVILTAPLLYTLTRHHGTGASTRLLSAATILAWHVF